jgi:hypothetical protein
MSPINSSKKSLKKIKIGVYQTIPSSNTIKFVEKGYVRYGKNFDDEKMNLDFLDKENLKFKVENNKVKFDETIYFEFFKDNLTSTYISKTTRIPIFHCAVMYQKKIVLGNLFNIYLFFNISNAKSITSFDQLIGSDLNGSYELIIEFNDKKDTLPFDTFTNYNDLINSLLELFSSDLMAGIIQSEMDKKDDERIKQYGQIDDYVIPEKVHNFNDMVKKYQETNGDMESIMK